jgi:hypothetical protein
VVAKYSEIFDTYDSADVGFIALLDLSEDGYFFEGLLNQFLAFFYDFEG